MASEMAIIKYAKAIVEVAGKNNLLDKICDDLNLFKDAFASSIGLKRYFLSQSNPREKKYAFIDNLGRELSLNILTMNFIKILIEKGRVGNIPEIAFEVEKIVNEMKGVANVKIYTASTLGDKEKEKIVKKLEKVIPGKLKTAYMIDKTILGGVIIKANNKLYDSSIKTQLRLMKTKILEL